MKTYNELITLSKEIRFIEVLNFITEKVKNSSVSDIIIKALYGVQDQEVNAWSEAFIISELCCKGFISFKQSECLIEMCK